MICVFTVVSYYVISAAILKCFDFPPFASGLAGEAAIRAVIKGKSQGKPSGKASTNHVLVASTGIETLGKGSYT